MDLVAEGEGQKGLRLQGTYEKDGKERCLKNSDVAAFSDTLL